MIGPLLLAVALSTEPVPAADRASLPPGANPAALDVPVTLALKDASLVDVLEKFSDLLGVTPILEPGLAGRISLDLREVPVSKALELVGKAGKVEIVVRGNVLRARSGAGARSAPAGPPSPTRAGPGFGDVVRFWREGEEERVTSVRVSHTVGRVEVPGCDGPLAIARLGPAKDASGIALAVRPASGARATARVLDGAAADGRKVLLAGCDGRLVVAAGDAASPGVLEPTAVEKGEPALATLRLLEVTEAGEESISEPRVAFSSGQGWAVSTRYTAAEAGGVGQEVEIRGVPLEVDDAGGGLLLAVFARIVRTPAPASAATTLVARRAESLWVPVGRPVRWTVDSSWDGGRAAIVLELTIERTGAAKR